MGETMPLYFKWFQNSQPVGEPIELILNDGDMYIMSEKAVGFDWLKKKIATLRHSTGCAKFTGVKNVQEEQKEVLKAAKLEQNKVLKAAKLEQNKVLKAAKLEQNKVLKAAKK